MKKNIYISVSTDPINDYQKVVDYAKELQGQTDFLHCDIMDGKFVNKKTYDDVVVKSINSNCLTMLDVHLMVEEPENCYQKYIDAGANILTFHYEAVKDKSILPELIKDIKDRHTLVGLSIKPETQFKEFKMFLYDIDVVLVMSVEPGLSGQRFMPEVIDKIKELEKFRVDNNLDFKIEIDGGISEENAKIVVDAGVDMLVSGSYVYNSKDRVAAISTLKNCTK